MGTPKPRKDAPKGKRYVAEAPRRRKSKPTPDVEREVLRLAGRRGPYLLGQLMEAAEAFANDRDRDAVRILRPVRDALPDSATVRELTGLAQYRVGNYRAASKELEAFVEITDAADAVDAHLLRVLRPGPRPERQRSRSQCRIGS